MYTAQVLCLIQNPQAGSEPPRVTGLVNGNARIHTQAALDLSSH